MAMLTLPELLQHDCTALLVCLSKLCLTDKLQLILGNPVFTRCAVDAEMYQKLHAGQLAIQCSCMLLSKFAI